MKNDPGSILLRRCGLRATPHRLTLLGTLATAKSPKTAEELHARIESADLVTIYRNLQSLVDAKLVNEVRFKDASVRYELASEGSHHHHVVCTRCGAVDELSNCDMRTLEKDVLKDSKRFTSIEEHSLEFFGTCNDCAKR